MSTRLVHRPDRVQRDITPENPVRLSPLPPAAGVLSKASGLLKVLLLLLGAVGMGLVIWFLQDPVWLVVGGGMFLVAIVLGALLWVVGNTGGRRKAKAQRALYIAELENCETALRNQAETQRSEALRHHPAPTALRTVIRQPERLWERRPSDSDFLVVRLGQGPGDLACGIEVPAADAVPDQTAYAHVARMLRRVERINDLPIAVPLRGVVLITGAPNATANAVRALMLQAAVMHSPSDLKIHLALPLSGAADTGSWALWLPHLIDDRTLDGPVGTRNVSDDAESAASLVAEIERRREEPGAHTPHLLIVVDADSEHGMEILSHVATVADLAAAGISVIVTSRNNASVAADIRISVFGSPTPHFTVDLGRFAPPAGVEGYDVRLLYGGTAGTLDDLSPQLADAIARELAPLRADETVEDDDPLQRPITLDALLGVGNFNDYNIEELWAPRHLDDFLTVPFGIDAHGDPVGLDIKESDLEGMGPHGICVGAAGSGKSELLQTIVLGNVVRHSPENFAIVLVDAKAGGTFTGFCGLPHTAAIVQNLKDSAGLITRLHDAILGEIQRRQRMMQSAGNVATIHDYNRLRERGQIQEPMPHLFIVIDGYQELLEVKPDFIDLLVQIGRIGHKVGLHLILATEHLEDETINGLAPYLNYHLTLRTDSATDSGYTLGTTDALDLPEQPGSGYLKTDNGTYSRFRAAIVSDPYSPSEKHHPGALPAIGMPLELRNTTRAWLERRKAADAAATTDGADDRSTIQVVLDRLRPSELRTNQIWLPPLAEEVGLEEVLYEAQLTSNRGLAVPRDQYLDFTLGVKDNPREQWRGPLTVNLAGEHGNLAIMGSEHSGKTTAVSTLVLSAALSHTPTEVNFTIVDMSGGNLDYLADLPHVTAVATGNDEERLNRMIAQLQIAMSRRQKLFTKHNLADATDMRNMQLRGALPEIAASDLFLVIDGWEEFKQRFDVLAEIVQNLAQRGLQYGIHVIFTTGQWSDFRRDVQEAIGSRIELRIDDPLASVNGRGLMMEMENAPLGRAVSMDKNYCQIALPTFNQPGVVRAQTAHELVAAITNGWNGTIAEATPVGKMLPTNILYDDLRAEHPGTPEALVGVTENDLSPAVLDLDGEQQLLMIIGDTKTGRTSTLRTIISELLAQHFPEQATFAIFDIRRTLLGFVPKDYISKYVGTTKTADIAVEFLQKELDHRMRVTTTGDNWDGPDIYIVVDDYELIEGSGNPLRPLIPYFAHANQLGLHVIIARSSSGMGRANYEAVIQALKDAGATGILLSGDHNEGQIWPNVYLQNLPRGRAQWVERNGEKTLIQLAHYPAPLLF